MEYCTFERENMTPQSRSRSTASAKKKSSSSAPRRRKSQKQQGFFSILAESRLGRFLLALFVTFILLGVNFLLSVNQFDRFFTLVGIELIIVVLLAWIRFVIRGQRDETKK